MTKPAFSFDLPEMFPCNTCGRPTDVRELRLAPDGHSDCAACHAVLLLGEPVLQEMVQPEGFSPVLPWDGSDVPF